MILSELWGHYEVDKRIQGLVQNTLKAYALQLKMLVKDHGIFGQKNWSSWKKQWSDVAVYAGNGWRVIEVSLL